MCGIAAIFAYDAGAAPVAETELLAVREAMARRGPDGSGLWIAADRRIGLAHRRLAIIDTGATGAQPMAFRPRDAAAPACRISYNGEIYNYRALRAELEAQGHVFATGSDTEVILQLYHRHGIAMVERLRGMFAFALWDEARGGLWLARDPLGIKPLYYADDGRTVRVASSVKALLAGGSVATEPEPAGAVGFFLWGSVPEPFTLHRRIRALEAGSTLWVDRGGARRPERFFDVAAALAKAEVGGEKDAPVADLTQALADSVRHHLVADVPVGVFLSAGLDSATVAALAAAEKGAALETLTLAFEEYRGRPEDESALAEEIARAFGTRHRTRRVTAADFAGELDALLAAMDQPSIDGVNVYFVAKAAREAGLKVALSGLGGDELFAGYDTFRHVPALVAALEGVPGARAVGRCLRRLAGPLFAQLALPKAAGVVELGTRYGDAYLLRRGLYLPWELDKVLDPDVAREGLRTLEPLVRLEACAGRVRSPRAKVTALEMNFYMRNQLLRDADWAGMAHGVEIRVPFVDAFLLGALAPALVGGHALGKADMARALRSLPPALLARPKTGFSVPVRQWLAGDAGGERGLRGWARRVYAAQRPG